MDLVAAFTSLQQAKIIASAQIAVAGKILANDRQDGAAAIKLLDAADQSVSQAGDALTAAAIGLGASLDVHA